MKWLDDVESTGPFLETDPPHWAARGLARLLLGFFAVAMVAAVVVRVPETVAGAFDLVPVAPAAPIRAAHEGTVTRVGAVEGQLVPQGTALFVLESEPVGERSAELRMLRARVNGATAQTANLRGEYASDRAGAAEEERKLGGRITSLDRTITLRKERLATARAQFEGTEAGYRRGAVSGDEVAVARLRLSQLALEIEESERERQEAKVVVAQLQHQARARASEERERERRLEEEVEGARTRIAALERDLANSSDNQVSVPAPCTGRVLRLRVRTAGAVVRDGDLLGDMACSGGRLRAEMTVPQSGVARLKAGQGVKLMYDAFPYQRHGVMGGTVGWVGPLAAASGDSGSFRALVDLREEAIRIDGQERALLPGMGGRALVILGRRSLLSYAFEPIRQLRENMAGAPGQ